MLLGLVCGQQRSKWFAEYLVRRAGLTMETVRRVSFREKRDTQPTTLSHFAAWTTGSKTPAFLERSDGYGRAWAQSYFKQDACNYCDDVFAELADATFMDAWLPGFQDDPRGTSIAITRSPISRDVLADGLQSGALDIAAMDISRVIRSQAGCLRLKRDGAALQVALKSNSHIEFHPRVKPAPRWSGISRYRKAAENRRMVASRTALAAQRRAGAGLDVFDRTINECTRTDSFVLGALSLLTVPQRAVRKAIRMASSSLSRTQSIFL